MQGEGGNLLQKVFPSPCKTFTCNILQIFLVRAHVRAHIYSKIAKK